MTSRTRADMPLQVWPACMNCYNSGRLIGAWIDAADSTDLTVEELHHLANAPLQPQCEELWCLDLDGPWPIWREMSLSEAQDWADTYAQVEPHLWPALSAWVATGAYVATGAGDVPAVGDFLAAYQGEWDSFRAYAENIVDDSEMMATWPSFAQTYFDWSSWTRDLALDFTTMPAPAGGVYVFSNP